MPEATTTSTAVTGLQRTLGSEMTAKVQDCSILMFGAGGIGTELLKSLAMSGFRHVEVADLDTIDVSNLNRQLLFRGEHVGQPKCTVACEVASKMVPPSDHPSPVKYIAHHGNICDNSKFNVNFVSQFDLVLNALDNVEARRRANRLCLAAKVPLVEAGTTGYLGQVTVIHKPSQVACYECKTQETQKVYPICTIRSTPSMPVHTIVWAKELYKLIFHSKVEESMLYEDPSGEEPSTYMQAMTELRALLLDKDKNNESNDDNDNASSDIVKEKGKIVLEKLYQTEISKQLDMGRYKTAKKTPAPLPNEILEKGLQVKQAGVTSTTAIWQPEHCVAEFLQCLIEASSTTNRGVILEEFDKDDALAMRLVTAASNLRSFVFGIEPLQSLYSAKGIAGNIIPAIATTNAICAGLQILQVFKILKLIVGKKQDEELNLKQACSYVNCLRNKTRNGLFLTASELEGPNPKCFVCRNADIPVSLSVKDWNLAQFIDKICKAKLGLEQPTIMLNGDMIWEEGEDADTEAYQNNLSKMLPDLPCGGIGHGTVVELEDFSQDLTIQVNISDKTDWEEEDEQDELPFHVGGQVPKPKVDDSSAKIPAAAAAPSSVAEEANKGDDDDDDDVVLVVDEGDENDGDKKRPAVDNATGASPAAKKAKMDNVISIDD